MSPAKVSVSDDAGTLPPRSPYTGSSANASQNWASMNNDIAGVSIDSQKRGEMLPKILGDSSHSCCSHMIHGHMPICQQA